MPQISLPDGSVREFDSRRARRRRCRRVSARVSLKDAVAARVNGELWDLTREIDADATRRNRHTRLSEDGVELLRHDAAHVLAEAVKELWPDTQVTIGPAIENGFYYDFAREEAVHRGRSRRRSKSA